MMSVSFRFIHAADLHVDSPFRGLTEVPSYVRDALQEATFRAAGISLTRRCGEVDFVVIAGDLYDLADRSLRAQLALQREWRRLHAHGVRLFVIHGNHDPLSGQQAKLSWPDGVHFFGADRVEQVPAYTKQGELAAYITGISYGSRSVTANLAAGYRAKQDGSYEIALLHGNVDGNDGHDPYAPCRLDELVGAGFHYWALGHIHQRAVLNRYPHVVYAGNTQGRHAKETGPKGCYVVDVSASHETELTFVPLDTIRWAQLRTPIDGIASEQALLDVMEAAASEAAAGCEGRSLMARFTLTGRGPLHAGLRDPGLLRELLDGLRERMGENAWQTGAGSPDGVWCWISGIEAATGADLDLDALAEEDSFVGELIRGSAEAGSHEASFKELLDEALQPLLGHAKLRKLTRSAMERKAADWYAQGRELAVGLLASEPNARPEGNRGQGGDVG